MSVSEDNFFNYVSYTSVIKSHGLYVFYPVFEDNFFLFKEFFFQKILSLCMVTIQEQFQIKKGLRWHGYGMSGQTSNQHNVPWLVARRKRLGGGGWAAARA